MRSDADRVTDILDAIAKIKQRMPGTLDAFLGDEMVQVWVGWPPKKSFATH